VTTTEVFSRRGLLRPGYLLVLGASLALIVLSFLLWEWEEDGGATEVSLTHSGFASEEIRELHAQGWEACISNLERYLSGAAS